MTEKKYTQLALAVQRDVLVVGTPRVLVNRVIAARVVLLLVHGHAKDHVCMGVQVVARVSVALHAQTVVPANARVAAVAALLVRADVLPSVQKVVALLAQKAVPGVPAVVPAVVPAAVVLPAQPIVPAPVKATAIQPVKAAVIQVAIQVVKAAVKAAVVLPVQTVVPAAVKAAVVAAVLRVLMAVPVVTDVPAVVPEAAIADAQANVRAVRATVQALVPQSV